MNNILYISQYGREEDNCINSIITLEKSRSFMSCDISGRLEQNIHYLKNSYIELSKEALEIWKGRKKVVTTSFVDNNGIIDTNTIVYGYVFY